MPLKCSNVKCVSFDLAEDNQLAFYQDLNNGGWNLALGPEYLIPDGELPPSIRLVQSGQTRCPYNIVCERCLGQIGKVNEICGFRQLSANFNGKKVSLLHSTHDRPSGNQKWSNIVSLFRHIRQITATVESTVELVGSDTVNFHSVKDLDEMIDIGNAVSRRSKLYPRNYQWRSYFFSCYNNVLLCLPTGLKLFFFSAQNIVMISVAVFLGMGKTLISTMLMKAYHQRNPKKGQTFIVPTVVLVSVPIILNCLKS